MGLRISQGNRRRLLLKPGKNATQDHMFQKNDILVMSALYHEMLSRNMMIIPRYWFIYLPCATPTPCSALLTLKEIECHPWLIHVSFRLEC